MFVLLCIVSIVGGTIGLGWYYQLSPKEREEADRLAAKTAQELFGRQLDELTASEAKEVAAFTERQFDN
jgi:hypothetical protein